MALPLEEVKQKQLARVCMDIDKMLESLSATSNKPFICKVPNCIRKVNEMAYEPECIAIGPYHRGKPHLKAMEERKIAIFQKLLEEREENNVAEFVKKMIQLEEVVRKCYAEPVDLHSDDFVKMLLIDGCFIVQVIRTYSEYDPIISRSQVIACFKGMMGINIIRDLLLVENQLPFFVLWELFAMIVTTPNQDIFMKGIFNVFWGQLPGKICQRQPPMPLQYIKHLPHFILHCCHPFPSESKALGKTKDSETIFDFKFISSATELQEAGVKFQKIEGNDMFDIKFENGTLYMPKIIIVCHTEHFFLNMTTFEQVFLQCKNFDYVSDYMVLMDHLINTPRDVEILSQHGIIQNQFGEDEAVATLFNKFGSAICYSPNNFYYKEVFKKANDHCSKPWNKWKANLKHKYFNGPWAFVSFLAAVIVLLLTALQTLFSILSYAK